MRQNYDKKYLQQFIDQYALGEIEKFFLFTSGYENSNYYLKTRQGEFVIKIFEGKGIKIDNILFELEVMDYSYSQGIKTPRVLKNKLGKLATVINDKYAC